MERVAVLDHGYVELIETWGSDESIISAARMSTNKGFLGWGPIHDPSCCWDEAGESCTCTPKPGDEKLLRFLWEHKHATPFEMAGMTIEVQAPIMVFREWHRHRTQSYNEMSARYTQLPEVFYVPEPERVTAQSKTNKQGSSAEPLGELIVQAFRTSLRLQQKAAYELYVNALESGVPRELARLYLPVSIYSRMRASANLRNWLSFLSLRMDAGAQWEIRMFANEVGNLIQKAYPRTWELFSDGRKPKEAKAATA